MKDKDNVINADNLPDSGSMHLYYGEFGKGKTTGVFMSAPGDIMMIHLEDRNYKPVLKIAKVYRPDLKVYNFRYISFDSLIDFISDINNFDRVQTVFADNLPYLMSVHLAGLLADEGYDAQVQKAKEEKKPLLRPHQTRVKTTLPDYGSLAQWMIRVMKLFGQLSAAGKTVIFTGHITHNPKYDRTLSAGPNFIGKQFSEMFGGFMDFIGLVEDRIVKDKLVYPPLVKFFDKSFMYKWTGTHPKQAQAKFNVSKIIEISNKPFDINSKGIDLGEGIDEERW